MPQLFPIKDLLINFKTGITCSDMAWSMFISQFMKRKGVYGVTHIQGVDNMNTFLKYNAV